MKLAVAVAAAVCSAGLSGPPLPDAERARVLAAADRYLPRSPETVTSARADLSELLPAQVLSPPDGGPAVAMLIALLASALFWNILTWWFALPNSSSHCLIGALIGVSVGNALAHSHGLAEGVHWHQLTTVLEGLALSPVLGWALGYSTGPSPGLSWRGYLPCR